MTPKQRYKKKILHNTNNCNITTDNINSLICDAINKIDDATNNTIDNDKCNNTNNTVYNDKCNNTDINSTANKCKSKNKIINVINKIGKILRIFKK